MKFFILTAPASLFSVLISCIQLQHAPVLVSGSKISSSVDGPPSSTTSSRSFPQDSLRKLEGSSCSAIGDTGLPIVNGALCDMDSQCSSGRCVMERDIVDIGNSFTNMGLCEGDCDKQSDCVNGLKCFHIDNFEPLYHTDVPSNTVPGCFGDPSIFGIAGYSDHCFAEALYNIGSDYDAAMTCGVCLDKLSNGARGTCYDHSDCESNFCVGGTCQVPTQAPTFTPVTVGSFEIQSIGNVTGEAVSGTVVELLAMYNASFRSHKTVVMSADCITPFPGTGTATDAFTVTDTQDVSLGSGNIAYNSTIGVDISILNTTGYLKALPGGGLGGSIDMCLESAVYLPLGDEDEKMNFVNTNLTLTVEMDANFEITTINAERKDATKENLTLDYSQYVSAYQCTATDLETAITGEYSQGDELKICVTSTDKSIVQVGSIKSLALSQAAGGAGGAGGAEFAYITGGLAVDDEIAATDCDKSISPHVCHADMQLLGRYFAVDEPGDLTASGAVELTFDTGRRLTVDVPIAGGIRGGDLLSLENSVRRMQDTPEESDFPVVKVALKSVDGSGTSDFNGATLLSGLVGAAGGVILMV